LKGFGVAFTWLKNKFAWFQGVASTIGKFFGFGGDDEDDKKEKEEKKEKAKEKKEVKEKKPINNMKFGKLKKAVAPIVLGTTLAANTISMPQQKLNEQSLNVSTQKETNLNNNSNALNSTVSKNYTINVTVQNPNSDTDISEAVKQAIKDIEADNNDRSMEDIH